MARPSEATIEKRKAHPQILALQTTLDDGAVVSRSVGFAKDLIRKYVHYGKLSPKQWEWVDKLSVPVAKRPNTEIDNLRKVVDNLDDRDKTFAKSMISQWDERGKLSPKQWPWVAKLTDKGLLAPTATTGSTGTASAPAPAPAKATPAPPVKKTVLKGYDGVDEFFKRPGSKLKQAKVHLLAKDNMEPASRKESLHGCLHVDADGNKTSHNKDYSKCYTASWHEVVVRTKRRRSEEAHLLYVEGRTLKEFDYEGTIRYREDWMQRMRDEATAKGEGDPFEAKVFDTDEHGNPMDGKRHWKEEQVPQKQHYCLVREKFINRTEYYDLPYSDKANVHKRSKTFRMKYSDTPSKDQTEMRKTGAMMTTRNTYTTKRKLVNNGGKYAGYNPKANTVRDPKRIKPIATDNGYDYYGVINRNTGEFHPTKLAESRDYVMSVMDQFRSDPVEATIRLGKKGGRCSFCAKHLSDHRSLAHGYGGTCAKNYGLPWSAKTAYVIEENIATAVKLRMVQLLPGKWAVIDIETNEVMMTAESRDLCISSCTEEWGEGVVYIPDEV